VDESATGSVNFFGPAQQCLCCAAPVSSRSSLPGIVSTMHLRMPSIDRGVQSFLWSVVFFLVLYFGMLAVGVAKGTSFLVSIVSAFLIFLFIRTRGD
jgi:hypothetical protein